ncbi:NF045616 family extracytoplasmic (lipo)protein [Acinetobacter guerrae]|uniref:NF045616 family extracytoplasmic (lipo)protein n=1 Tax=Acinetobacter guerrae TaxID=1843371 RepID=UPI0030C8CFC3
MKKSLCILLLSFLVTILGCDELYKDLNIKNNQLCIFNNNSRKYRENNFLVHIGKINFSEENKSDYEKSYQETIFPIDESSCIYSSK